VSHIVEQRKLKIEEKAKEFARQREARRAGDFEPLPPTDDQPPAEVTPPSPQPAPSAPAPAPAPTPAPEDEDDDIDFDDFEDDDATPKVEAPEEEEDEEEEEQDYPDADSSAKVEAWRERVKEQGRKRKLAEAKAVELEVTVEELQSKLRLAESKNKEIATANINWNSHEAVTPMWSQFDDIVVRGAQAFTDATSAKKFRADSQAELLTEYYGMVSKAKTADERLEADISFKQELADRYNVEDGTPLLNSVRGAMEKYMEIQDKVELLKQQHEQGQLSLGLREYQETVRPFEPIFEDMGTVDDAFVQANPYSPEAVVARLCSEDDKFKEKADSFKDRLKQFVFGLKPLTQEELDKAAARATSRGMGVKEFLALREDNYKKQRSKFLSDVFFAGMAVEEFPAMRKVYDKYKSNQKKRDAAKQVISKSKAPETVGRKPSDERTVKAADRPYVPPSQRNFEAR
jgi:hypothetical protein